MLRRAYIRKCLPQEVRKDFIRPLRTLYKAPTRPLRSLKNPYKALRVFLLRHSTVIAIRQFLVYFQARDALGKSQGYLGSSVRPEDTKDLQISQGNS